MRSAHQVTRRVVGALVDGAAFAGVAAAGGLVLRGRFLLVAVLVIAGAAAAGVVIRVRLAYWTRQRARAQARIEAAQARLAAASAELLQAEAERLVLGELGRALEPGDVDRSAAVDFVTDQEVPPCS